MSEPSNPTPSNLPFRTDRRARTRFEAAAVGLRFAVSIARRFGVLAPLLKGNTGPLEHPLTAECQPPELLDVLSRVLEQAGLLGVSLDNNAQCQAEIRHLRSQPLHPISRVVQAVQPPELGHHLADLLLLSILPDLHEDYAALFRLLHPQNLPYPTASLALHWLEDEATYFHLTSSAPAIQNTAMETWYLRDAIEDLLLHAPIAKLGMVRLTGDGPWHGRLLRPGPGAWAALNARPLEQRDLRWIAGVNPVPGLDAWLQQAEAQEAIAALQLGEPCLIVVLGGSEPMRTTRVRALLGAAGSNAIHHLIYSSSPMAERQQQAIDTYIAAFMQQAYPWLAVSDDGEANPSNRLQIPDFEWGLPLLVSAKTEQALPDIALPILALRITPLAAAARRDMWNTLLPGLGGKSNLLAARYHIDPEEARQVAADLVLHQRLNPRPLEVDDIGACLRSRTLWRSQPGVHRVAPKADWSNLALPANNLALLQQAVRRVHQQITVLDDWGFEQGRQERRCLRILFCGQTGTGKSLAAEAMAQALGVDLLVVTIASLVSKWVGEAETSLASLIELAESSRALLLFDGADALFERRTDTYDTQPGHTNIDTTFLLQRLEHFEGVAILTTHQRMNLDAAFTRRFDYIVDFPEPDAAARLILWQLHLPPNAPLHHDIDLVQLADWYPICGAQIRSAALGAAFLAAAESSAISQRHLVGAIEREYDKASKVHPGFPPNTPSSRKAPSSKAHSPPVPELYSLTPFDQ